jgi:hypothetical protein
MGWTARDGNLWIFGGFCYADPYSGYMNDLWEFNITSREWTWVGGTTETLGYPIPQNTPRGRADGATWTDDEGNFWLFGGVAESVYGGANLNDLWKFDFGQKEWTLVSGSILNDDPGSYGQIGVPGGIPPSRRMAMAWKTSDKFWLYGGLSKFKQNAPTSLSDMWSFDIKSMRWTWEPGSSTPEVMANYGIQNIAAPTNTPGARKLAIAWSDKNGILWMFGGEGYFNNSPYFASAGTCNDLWKYDTKTKLWTWIKGKQSSGQFGTFGTPEVLGSENIPSARTRAAYWTDAFGVHWLFGGGGKVDVWKLQTQKTDCRGWGLYN